MNRHLFLGIIAGICFSFDVKAATETELITQTLTDYIEGTANGEPDRLRKAFHPDFKLYAVSPADELLIRSGEQYIEGFPSGKKTNRIARILSIDVENNTASAKVEV